MMTRSAADSGGVEPREATSTKPPGFMLLKMGLRTHLRRPTQTALMVLGVALGVSVVIAIDLANTSAERAFTLSTESVVGRATHQIRGGPAGVPDALYAQLRSQWGFENSAPVVEGHALALDQGMQPVTLLGLDPLAEGPFRGFLTGGMARSPGFERFYTKPGMVIVGDSFASRYSLTPGDKLRLQAGDRIFAVTVLGVLTPAEASEAAGLEDVLLMDVAGAQEMIGTPGHLTRIDLILTPSEAGRLAALLPPGTELVPASQEAETASQLASAFQLNLTALSMLALVVGMFLIYNTMTFAVVERREILGTLRALGVTQDQIVLVLLAEAGIVSAVGSMLGIGLGWLLGQGAVRLVSRTISDFYFVLSVTQAPLTVAGAMKGLGLGVLAGLVSAAIPAVEAGRSPAITVMRRSSLEDRLRGLSVPIALGGVLLAGVGTGVILVSGRSILASFGGLFAILLGLALTVPAVIRGLMLPAGSTLYRLVGTLGRVAARTVDAALSRTGVAVAALMIAISVTIGVTVMIASFRETVVNWLDLTLRADVYVSSPAETGTRPVGRLSPGLADKLKALSGVEAVESYRGVEVQSEYGTVLLSVVDARRERDARLYRFASGAPGQIWQGVVSGGVIVSEPFAYRHNIPAHGGRITLITDRGPEAFPVEAIYYDYATDRGTVLMSENVFLSRWEDPGVSSFGVFFQRGADVSQGEDLVRAALAGTGLEVQANRAIRDRALEIFDRTFAITAALRLLTILVAFVGVMSAVMALLLERTRELATFQALGLTSGGVWKLILMETGLMGATAGVFSWPVGIIMATVLIYVINLRSFGWTIRMVLTPSIFVEALLLAILAAIVAGIYPAWRLMRMPVADALRME
jgi:putative ABC transport system permease protein